jgi:topoisomerase-4 subunit B
MYIGKLGNGTSYDDGIYILVKEILDNSIDEYVMGHGKKIELTIKEGTVTVRDFGRGIPLGKVIDCVSKINTGGKYDSKAFKKSVGLNGVGTKAVNALSDYFVVESFREGEVKKAEFDIGALRKDEKLKKTEERNGTRFQFRPDNDIFKNYSYKSDHVIRLIKNYCYLNPGLSIWFNSTRYFSEKGLYDLLEDKMSSEPLYPIVHLMVRSITHLSMDSIPRRAVLTKVLSGKL